MLGVYRIAPAGVIGQPEHSGLPDVKPPRLLIMGLGMILALGLVAGFVYWNETRR